MGVLELLAIPFAASVSALVAFVFTGMAVEAAWRQQAIKHNAAEWRIDPKTGEKTFVWITQEVDE